MFDCFEEQKALVESFVGVKSVVGSEGGEQAAAEFVHDWLSRLDYFKANPEHLKIFPTDNDTLRRSSVMAFVRGGDAEASSSEERTPAVLLMGHIDTVETEDYGSLEPLATRPRELEEAFRELLKDEKAAASLGKDFAEDLKSGRFMFGRGALDMKSGVACYLYILKYFSQHPEELKGSLIALFECDEEGDSHGMFTGIREIDALREKEKLDIKAALCADYSSKEAAIYLGTIGKYLPCIMAFGRSSHVGQVFSSLDPSLLISETVRAIDYNTAYSEENLGETTPPPVSLKVSDTKENYSVQTAESAYAYFNWFALKKSEEEVLELCRKEAVEAAERTRARINEAKKAYAERALALGIDPSKDESLRPLEPVRVYTLKEYAELLGESLSAPPAGEDIRKFWVSEASRLRLLDQDRSPVVLVFMAGISYPPITVDPESELAAAARDLGLPVRTYYPFISDVSFVSLLGDIPAANLGTYGKDAHMFTERADMDHCFLQLPNLTWELLKKLLA